MCPGKSTEIAMKQFADRYKVFFTDSNVPKTKAGRIYKNTLDCHLLPKVILKQTVTF